MGKRIDKAFGKDKENKSSNNSNLDHDDDVQRGSSASMTTYF